MTTAVVVQARMDSHRFPGKVLAEILPGVPMLAYMLERVQRARLDDVIVVATTTNAADDPVEALAERMGVRTFRGSEHDVLRRYMGAAAMVGAQVVVRLTADCPLIDPAHVDAAITRFAEGDADHLEVVGVPDGMQVEVTTAEVLGRTWGVADTEEREHVTLHMRRRPETFRLVLLDAGGSEGRWTVDETADLELVRRVAEEFGRRPFAMEDVARLLVDHPDWTLLNAGIARAERERELGVLVRGVSPSINLVDGGHAFR